MSSIHIVCDDQSKELARVSAGDCAIEIEHYPGVGVHILINTPPNSNGETEELELWVQAESARFLLEQHLISGEGTADGIPEPTAPLPNNVLNLPGRSKK